METNVPLAFLSGIFVAITVGAWFYSPWDLAIQPPETTQAKTSSHSPLSETKTASAVIAPESEVSSDESANDNTNSRVIKNSTNSSTPIPIERRMDNPNTTANYPTSNSQVCTKVQPPAEIPVHSVIEDSTKHSYADTDNTKNLDKKSTTNLSTVYKRIHQRLNRMMEWEVIGKTDDSDNDTFDFLVLHRRQMPQMIPRMITLIEIKSPILKRVLQGCLLHEDAVFDAHPMVQFALFSF
jgi:hypothetical protein